MRALFRSEVVPGGTQILPDRKDLYKLAKGKTMSIVFFIVCLIVYHLDQALLDLWIPKAEKALAEARAPAVWEEKRAQPKTVEQRKKKLELLEETHIALLFLFWLSFIFTLLVGAAEVGIIRVTVK